MKEIFRDFILPVIVVLLILIFAIGLLWALSRVPSKIITEEELPGIGKYICVEERKEFRGEVTRKCAAYPFDVIESLEE